MFCKDPYDLEEGAYAWPIMHSPRNHLILIWLSCSSFSFYLITPLTFLPFFPCSGTPNLFSRLRKMRPITSPSLLAAIFHLIASGSSQFPPTPKGLTRLESNLNAGIYISYKEVRRFDSRWSQASDPSLSNWPFSPARNMRDNSRGQVLRWLFTFTAWDVDGRTSGPELFHWQLFLVFWVANRPCKRTSVRLDEWRPRNFFYGRSIPGERPMYCESGL